MQAASASAAEAAGPGAFSCVKLGSDTDVVSVGISAAGDVFA